MGYYINQNGGYYEGDKAHWQDQTVPQRPGANHAWNGSEWVAIPLPVPIVVTMHQARAALIEAGLFDSVEQAIAAMTGIAGQLARNDWEQSPTLKRDHPLVASLSAALGLSAAQLDDLFTAADGL